MKKLQQLLRLLSYSSSNGWVAADKFDPIRAHRFSLVQARDSMGVIGAFCWLSGQGTSAVSAPLVYVATAADLDQAQAIHRKVWSQGLVPFLIIATPKEVLICPGFKYASEQWQQNVHAVSWREISAIDKAGSTISEAAKRLINLRARRLRSSIFWREHAIDVSGRVDQTLLAGLSGLSHNLIQGVGVDKCLGHTAANGLIGKLLYLYFLVDRDIINQDWLNSRGHAAINLADAKASWNKRAFWRLLDDLDSIFNGSIFPLSPDDRAEIDATHIHLARAVLKHGAKTQAGGAVQLSFLDIDLSVLRVETLSAVYEQFLENVKCGERRRVGAYYTPPFLVDLVLDRVEDELRLEDGVTVLDPTAGSGVFLVGAYRRILEHARATSPDPLSLDQIRRLLVHNIFGVERNADACHVTAFSLYLTMLDYVRPRDLNVVASGGDPKKLFPGLVGTNLFSKDFFSKDLRGSIPPIRCVVGNPPWQTLGRLESHMATKWASDHPDCPIGKDQAAEIFVWKALREHLVEDGVLAMLIPSKSFVNPTAAGFRSHLQDEAYVRGAINFSHLRHKLFSGAKHACAALFLRKRKPRPADWTWVYTPLSISQPIPSKDTWPWTLVMDEAEIQYFRHDALAAAPRGWFEAFVLKPVDRQIQRYITDFAASGSIALLGRLCSKIGAKCKRGGNASDTGLPTELLDDGPHVEFESEPNRASAKPIRDLFETDKPSFIGRETDRLSLSQLSKAKPSYKNQFSGNILLVPRNFKNVRFIDYPKAYTSSYLAVFFDKPGNQVSDIEIQFLRALEKYLNSSVALYFLATIGRRWLIDRRNIEPADFASLPVPFTSLDDERVKHVLAYEGKELEDFLLKAFKLDRDLRSAIYEFLDFRMWFQDGNVPDAALTSAKQGVLASYSRVFQRSLDGLVGRKGTFKVAYKDDPESGVGVIVAHYVDESAAPDPDLTSACQKAIEVNKRQGNNPFNNSLVITINPDTSTIAVVKPLEYFRWTVDSAYADSRRVMDEFMREAA